MGVLDWILGEQYTAGKAQRAEQVVLRTAAEGRAADMRNAAIAKTSAIKAQNFESDVTKMAQQMISQESNAIKSGSLRYRMGQEGIYKALTGRAKKVGFITAGVLAGAGLLGIVLSNRPKPKPKADYLDNTAAVMPMMPMVDPQAVGPADGRGPTEWRDRFNGAGAAPNVTPQVNV